MRDQIILDFFSGLGHFLSYSVRRPKTPLETGLFIISTDIDVGAPKLGVVNRSQRDKDVNIYLSESNIGKIEELAVPLFVELFDHFEIPVTFAVRGQLTEFDSQVMNVLVSSSVKHDIGAHGYSHMQFTNLCRDAAEGELRMINVGMRKHGLVPRTFIFPRNRIAYLDLLEKYGYSCYRGQGNIATDCMYIERIGRLYNVHPSIYVDRNTSPLLFKKILNIAIKKRLPFHMYLHFWNFGENRKTVSKSLNNLFVPLLVYAKKQQDRGVLTFETMLSAVEIVKSYDHVLSNKIPVEA